MNSTGFMLGLALVFGILFLYGWNMLRYLKKQGIDVFKDLEEKQKQHSAKK